MDTIQLNKKANNYDYAPGIATYGGNGEQGPLGEHGNCIFFTSYNLLGGEDLPDLQQAIIDSKLPIKNGIQLPRKYQNGDYFFDATGTIFRLHDVDKLTRFPVLSDNYKVYFTLCGQIKSNNDANALFTTTANTNKISLNSHYTGLDINNTKEEIPNNNSDGYALRIFGDNVQNKSDIVEILHATPFYNFTQNADFKIYYDGINNVWHLDSEVPIVIDSEVQINDDNKDIIDLDDYSSVIISDTPITSFYNVALNIQYKLTPANGTTKLSLECDDDTKKVFYEFQNVKLHVTDDTYKINYMKNVDMDNLAGGIEFTETTKELKNINVSLIHNIEVYILRK